MNKTLKKQYEIMNSPVFQNAVKISKICQNNGFLEKAQQIAQSHSNIFYRLNFLQQYQEMIQPFHHIASTFNAKHNEIIKLNNSVVKSTKIYIAMEKLSAVNYVFWEFIPMALAEQLYGSDDTNIVLEEYELQTNGIETKKYLIYV